VGMGPSLTPPGCDISDITSGSAKTAQQQGEQLFTEWFGPRLTVPKHTREIQLWGTHETGQPMASCPE